MQKDVEDFIAQPAIHRHPKQRYYDCKLFLERLAGITVQRKTNILRRPRNVVLVQPNPLFENFQPIVQTLTIHGDCHNTNYDYRDQGERVGVININVRQDLVEPKEDQSVQTIIQDYFLTQFEGPAMKCNDCPRMLPGTQSFSVINSPEFIAFAIER